MATSTDWRLELLGPGRLSTAEAGPVALSVKLLVALAYLALEGPSSRSRLAYLLWPEAPESAARNNLVQLFRRAKQHLGVELVQGQDIVELSPTLGVDTRDLSALYLDGGFDDRLVGSGPLLSSLVVHDLPDVMAWVQAQRERVDEQRAALLRREAERLEHEGDFAGAALRVEQRLCLDPLSEDAYRRLMRLRHLQGDTAGALQVFATCEAVLARELQTTPSPETRALAREIAQGEEFQPPPGPPPASGVLGIVPPPLVGREEAWARMEAAWRDGKLILLSGPPGIGKTRLALDFAASKGRVLRVDARPGDAVTPFATNSRIARAHLALDPRVDLPGWAREALSQHLPELRRGATPRLPRGADQQRLFDAQLELVRRTSGGLAAIVVDNLQFFDDASLALGSYLISHAYPLSADGGVPPHLAVYRSGELSPERASVLERLVAAGIAVQVELAPLTAPEVQALLDALGVAGAPQIAPRLTRFTGGNPQLLLDTINHLTEIGALPCLPDHLPLPPGVQEMVARRLSRLSPSALQVARAAAIIEGDLTVDLVAGVLGAPLLDTLSAWEELQGAHVLHGQQFVHDLMLEAVRCGIPEGVRRLLSRSAARALERQNGPPARIATLWLEGGEPAAASRWYIKAGEAAAACLRLREAAAFYHQAADAAEAAEQRHGAEQPWGG